MPPRRASGGAGLPVPGPPEPSVAGGPGTTCTRVRALVDTNVLVYRFDPRFPEKQRVATEMLRQGLRDDTVRVPHQAIVEFVAAVTRPLAHGDALLTPEDIRREAEEFR